MDQPTDRDAEIAALLPSVYKEPRRMATATTAGMSVDTRSSPLLSFTNGVSFDQ